NALIGDAPRPAEVHGDGPRLAVHEHRILLANPEIAEIDPGVPQPEGIRSAARGLIGTLNEVRIDEGMHVPVKKRRGRPGLQADAADAGAEVGILSVRLWHGNSAGYELVLEIDRVEVVKADQADESPEPKRGSAAWDQEGARKHA